MPECGSKPNRRGNPLLLLDLWIISNALVNFTHRERNQVVIKVVHLKAEICVFFKKHFASVVGRYQSTAKI